MTAENSLPETDERTRMAQEIADDINNTLSEVAGAKRLTVQDALKAMDEFDEALKNAKPITEEEFEKLRVNPLHLRRIEFGTSDPTSAFIPPRKRRI